MHIAPAVFLLQAAHKIALSYCKCICKYICYVVSTFVIKLLGKLVCNYLCCCLQFAVYYSLCIY